MRALRFSAAIAVIVAMAAPARGDDAVPWFLRNRPPLDDVASKVEGSFFSGLPLIGFDTNTGVGLGAGAYYTRNGPRTSPLFAYAPYQDRVFAQVYATTGGYQQHELSYDAPYVLGSPFRVRVDLTFERNTNANYFGVGAASLGPLTFHGTPHATYAEQLAAASALGPGGTASPKYNHYAYDQPSASASLERGFLGGRLRVQYGFIVQRTWIRTYDGQRVTSTDAKGHDVAATEGPTKLGIDCAQSAVAGCGGGWNDLLKAGIAFDTRDFEPDPKSGIFVEATGEWSTKAIGATFDYVRLTASGRVYASPFGRKAGVVVAGRLLYSLQSNGAPFFAMSTLASTEGDQGGLGGERTLRGYRQDRFVGRAAVLANTEVRWTFVHFPLLGQRFSLQVAPFFDTGRVFDRLAFALTEWKPSAGAGLRIGWNRSTIILFDFGASREDTGFYIDFAMPY